MKLTPSFSSSSPASASAQQQQQQQQNHLFEQPESLLPSSRSIALAMLDVALAAATSSATAPASVSTAANNGPQQPDSLPSPSLALSSAAAFARALRSSNSNNDDDAEDTGSPYAPWELSGPPLSPASLAGLDMASPLSTSIPAAAMHLLSLDPFVAAHFSSPPSSTLLPPSAASPSSIVAALNPSVLDSLAPSSFTPFTPFTYHPYPLAAQSSLASLSSTTPSSSGPASSSISPANLASRKDNPLHPNSMGSLQPPHQFLSLAQIAPPPQSVPTPVSALAPSALSLASTSSMLSTADVQQAALVYHELADDVNMDDSDSDPSDSDMEEDEDDDDGVDASYKEHSRTKRNGPKTQRSLGGAASSQRRSTKNGDAIVGGAAAANGKRTAGARAGSHTPSNGANSGSSSSAPPTKKRGNTRITVAEFVPPDVTGLSKREARLVKNRAAAFLSRQRKREEFESMEARLTEALEENARLRAHQGQPFSSPSPAPQDDGDEEVERLKALLRQAEERERALREELDQQQHQPAQIAQVPQPTPQLVKTEDSDNFYLRMPGGLDMSFVPTEPKIQDRRVLSSKDKERHGPGISLMMLVFSLTLLSLPHGHQLTNRNQGHSAPTHMSFAPSGSSTVPLPVLSNLLEKWEGQRLEGLDGIDDEGSEDGMEIEMDPSSDDENEEEEGDFNNDHRPSYVVDFEMPVLAGGAEKDGDGNIRVRIQPCGAPRPRNNQAETHAHLTAIDAIANPALTASTGYDLTSAYEEHGEAWAGWREFLNEEVFGADSQANAHLVPANVADLPANALSPLSETDGPTTAAWLAGSDTTSERYMTPPPSFMGDEQLVLSPGSNFEATTILKDDLLVPQEEAVGVDVPVSSLPSWSRALIRAAAGEKVRARIRMTRGPKFGARGSAKLKAKAGKTRLSLKI